MPRKNQNTDLKAFAIIGVVGLALLVFGPTAWLVWSVMTRPAETPAPQTATSTVSGPVGALGEMNSTCGGPNRLPCRPGLKCSNGSDYVKTGICEKDESAAKPGAQAYRQLGEACRYAFPSSEDCVPGLVCRMPNASSTTGECAKPENTSPQILKVKLEGAEPANGEYFVSAKTSLSFTVETVNAKSAKLLWVPDKGSPVEGTLVRETGGTFASPLKGVWQAGVTGTLTIRVFAEDGSFAVLSYRLIGKE